MRVLIADDHPLFVDGVCSLLEAHGIEVAGTVGDGQAAITEALRLEPDLVLMDLNMPSATAWPRPAASKPNYLR